MVQYKNYAKNNAIYLFFLLWLVGFPQLKAAQQASKHTDQKPKFIEEKEGKMPEKDENNTSIVPKGLVYNHTLHIGKYVNNEVEEIEDEDDTFEDILNDHVFGLKRKLKNEAEELILATILQSKQKENCYKYLFSNKGLVQGEKIVAAAYKKRFGYQLIKTTSPHVIIGLLEWLHWSQQQSLANKEFYKTYTPKALFASQPVCKGCYLIARHMFKIDLNTNEKGCLALPCPNKIDMLPDLAQQYIDNHLTLPLVEQLIVPMLGYVEEEEAKQKQADLQTQLDRKETKLQQKENMLEEKSRQLEAKNKDLQAQQAQITALQMQVNEKEKTIAALQEDITNRRQEIDKLKLEAKEKDENIAELEEDIRRVKIASEEKDKQIKEAIDGLPTACAEEERNSTYKGMNKLHIAVCKGCIEIVEAIVKKSPELAKGLAKEVVQNNQCKKCYNGCNSLHLAVYSGHVEVVKVLLKGLPELAKVLTKQVGQNKRQEIDGFNALHIAVHFNYIEIIEVFIKEFPELVKALAKQVVQDNNFFYKSMNVLQIAAYKGHAEIVKVFIEQLPEITKALAKQRMKGVHTYKGFNVLHLVASKDQYTYTEVIKVLFKECPELAKTLAKQVLQNNKGYNGFNMIHIAALNDCPNVVKVLVKEVPGLTKVLLAKQVVQNNNDTYFDYNGFNVMHVSAVGHVSTGSANLVKVLLEEFPELTQELAKQVVKNKRWTSGFNALHVAVYSGHVKVVEEVFIQALPELTQELAKQVVKNKHWSNGFNAMHIAVRSGRTEVVEVFIQALPELTKELAKESVQSNNEYNGLNALQIAKKEKKQDMVALLKAIL